MAQIQRHPGGRPLDYKPEYAQQLIEFFQDSSERFPTKARFAVTIGVCRQTLYDWATKTDDEGNIRYPEFSDAYKKAQDYQEATLIENALQGKYNPTFAIFTAKNILGWRDRQELTGADGKDLIPAEKPEVARWLAFMLTQGLTIEGEADAVDE